MNYAILLLSPLDKRSGPSFEIKICRFEIIDGVKYVYCIKHAYKFVLREQVGFAAAFWRLRQGVSCVLTDVFLSIQNINLILF